MMNSKQLRAKAWDSLKGKYWLAFIVVIVVSTLGSLGASMISGAQSMVNVLTMVDPSEMDSTMIAGAAVLLGVASVISIIGIVLNIFVGGAANVGLCNYFIKNTDSKPSFKDAFSGFKVKYGRNTGALLLVSIKVALWSILFVIPGIIKAYEYAIIPYILADDAEISTKDAFAKAKQMMKGNKWRLFKLEFSFIGWFILCILTLGMGTFFLIPYIEAANAEFYAELKSKQA